MSRKAAVLLFGAFNPVTNAHLHIGTLAQKRYPDYEIIYVPARLSYFQKWKGVDSSEVLPEELRLSMLRAAVSEYSGFSVSDVELKGIVNGRTWNTLQYFRDTLGYEELVLCMGTDKVSELETWFRGEDLLAGYRFLIITRSGDRLSSCMTPVTLRYQDHFEELADSTFSTLSATEVRNALQHGDYASVREAMPPQASEILFRELGIFS